MQKLSIPLIAASLGGVESLVTIPAQSTHLMIGPEGRKVGALKTQEASLYIPRDQKCLEIDKVVTGSHWHVGTLCNSIAN